MPSHYDALLGVIQAQASGQAGGQAPNVNATPLADATSDLSVLASRYAAGVAEGARGAEANRTAAKGVLDEEARFNDANRSLRQETGRVRLDAQRANAAAQASQAAASLAAARARAAIQDARDEAKREEAFAIQRNNDFKANLFNRYGPRFNNAFDFLAKAASESGVPLTATSKLIDKMLLTPEFRGVSKSYLEQELANFERYVGTGQGTLATDPVVSRIAQRR